MAFGNGGPYCVVVQVRNQVPSLQSATDKILPSFLIKDAQQDIAGARLKA